MKANANDSMCQKEGGGGGKQGYDLQYANSYEQVSEEEPFHNADSFNSSWCVRNEVSHKRTGKATSKSIEERASSNNDS